MILGQVEVPEEAMKAIDEDRLVVFAGAGVSMSPPSNLPDFRGLAEKILRFDVIKGEEDRTLGEYHQKGVKIYHRCKEILNGKHTLHTELHESILKLFKEGDKVRLVTTNFDAHFTSAAKVVYAKNQPKEYFAPALPLGDNFRGVVYLHGSVVEEFSKPILTDRDFGEAYLTRGWASQFLVNLFTQYSVLFVGYSHSDLTMNYLARGLNSSTTEKRWALLPHNLNHEELNHWKHLNIAVIKYPLDSDNKENEHIRLTNFFSEWANYRETSLLLKVNEAKQYGSGIPPESVQEEACIKYYLSDKDLARSFLNAIQVKDYPVWFGWLEEHNFFDVIFSYRVFQIKDSEEELMNWLVGSLRLEYPDLLFYFIGAHEQRMNERFLDLLAWSLYKNKKGVSKEDQYFSEWIMFLISLEKLKNSDIITLYLLQQCTMPKDSLIALQIFEIITKPKLSIYATKELSSFRNTGAELGFPSEKLDSGFWIKESYEKIFTPNLEHIWEPLLRLCEKQIYDLYRLQSLIQRTSKGFDSFSFDRQSIAVHEQDKSPMSPVFSCIVDLLRDILVFLMESNYPRALLLRELWWDSGNLILKRLSLFSYSIDNRIAADEAIRCLLTNDLIFRSKMKKEVFDILAKFYGAASLTVKKQVLESYEKYNVLIWLKRHEEDCPFLNTALNQIQTEYPDFTESEHSELNCYRGSINEKDSFEDADIDEILSDSPSEFIESLKPFKKDFISDNWDRYYRILPTLFIRNHAWGSEFIKLLSMQEGVNKSIWNHVFFEFCKVLKSPEDWKWILDVLEKLPHKSEIYSGIAYFISHSFPKEDLSPSSDDLDRMTRLMKRAWELCSQESENTQFLSDWYTTAINHVGGWIADFWVNYCGFLYNQNQENWKGLPCEIKSMIAEAVGGDSATQTNARNALFGSLRSWYCLDADFTKEMLLPMLNFSKNSERAQQLWTVLLNYNHIYNDLGIELIPYYEDFVNNTEYLEQYDEKTLRSFGSKVALIFFERGNFLIESNWIDKVFPLMPKASRISFADKIEHLLKKWDLDKNDLWKHWLCEYIRLRLDGLPVPLIPQEGEYMLKWCLHLEPVFCDAVELLIRVPLEKIRIFSIVKDLLDSPMADNKPLCACELINVVLEFDKYPHLSDDLIRLEDKWRSSIGTTEVFEQFKDLLVRRGWNG